MLTCTCKFVVCDWRTCLHIQMSKSMAHIKRIFIFFVFSFFYSKGEIVRFINVSKINEMNLNKGCSYRRSLRDGGRINWKKRRWARMWPCKWTQLWECWCVSDVRLNNFLFACGSSQVKKIIKITPCETIAHSHYIFVTLLKLKK